MLASQFLSVVMDDDAANRDRTSQDLPNSEDIVPLPDEQESYNSSDSVSEENGGGDVTEKDVIQQLQAHCKLPKALLDECCISLVNPGDPLGKQTRECRFDAYVTPVTQPRLRTVPLSKLQEPQCKDVDPLDTNIEALLQGVEAVYSDEGETDVPRETGYYKKSRCAHCNRAFYSDGRTLCRRCSQAHTVRNHGEEYIFKGFKCEVCGKCYSQKSVLKKHEAIHSGYRLRCKVCGMDFTQRSSLLRHCKRIHGIMSDSEITTPLVPPDPRQTIGGQNSASKLPLSISPAKPTHLVIPKPLVTVSKANPVPTVDRTPNQRAAFLPAPIVMDSVQKFKDRRIAAQEMITLDTSKEKSRIGPYSVNPHTAMTITPDFILQMDDD
ncbi:Hypothetical protein NTJ_09026 [Nesidiocoris tenuis]|uniref:C2H2-type domain-containing protein n=1 Tax=Nesidiocoris tenuis TaxID=355587 RepID=A0ABN7B0G2_9HEMI|nr:Hypothetical protein NTJ_09026 [Nesidiocoris tenuis]